MNPIIEKLNENKEFLYSLLLIVGVPAVLIANTLFFVNRTNNDFNTELTNKANLATGIFGSSIKDSATDSAKLHKLVTQAADGSKDIKGLTVLGFIKNNPVVLASNEAEEATSSTTILQSKLAWTTGQPYTTKHDILNSEGKTSRIWQVALPIREATKSIAVVNLKISGEKSDLLVNNLTRDSIYFTLGALVVIILLLLNHLRFFGYAQTFNKLKELDEMKDNFISLASHELRTPVTALQGFATLAYRKLKSGKVEEATRDVEMVDKSAEGIASLVNDLLDVSRIEQKRINLDIKDVSLSEVIAMVIEELKAQAAQKNLQLNYSRLPTPMIISVDEQKLKQVLVNIVGNAIKYTPSGSVTVSNEISNGVVKTFVTDTGLGIPAEELPKLFSKFHRVQNDKTKNIRGTGLGLWITKQFVEMMKGKIMVESIENTGTKFIISFPLKKPA